MDTTDVLAWLGVGGAALALLKQGWDIFWSRKKEEQAIDEALEKQPIVKQHLELGNVGEAVKHLNVIINGQAKHIDRLTSRETALEAESALWQARYHGVHNEVLELRAEIARLRTLIGER